MALQKQTITLDFGFGGLDQKADPKLVQRVRFTQLENARFNKVGRIDRRNGNAASFTTQIETISATQVTAVTFSATISKLIASDERLLGIGTETSAGPPKPYRLHPSANYASNRVLANSAAFTNYMPVSQLRAVDFGPSAVLENGLRAG